ncbi:hypothetical protein UlMin_020580 [Ulmus minor]
MAQSSLSSILNQNKLTGDNFVDWKRNLLIILSFEKHKYVLEKYCPPVPNENASSEESMAFDNWVNLNEIACCYMMASMNNVLQKQHEGYLNARDIMHNVEDMFGGQSVLVRQVAVRNLMNCKHKPGTPIKDHMLTANLTEAGNSSKPSNGKGKKFKQVASKTSSIPTSDDKVKKKKKKNPKKSK